MLMLLLMAGLINPGCRADSPTNQNYELLQHRIISLRNRLVEYSNNGDHPCAREACAFIFIWSMIGPILNFDPLAANQADATPPFYVPAIDAGLAPLYTGPDGVPQLQRQLQAIEQQPGGQPRSFAMRIFSGTVRFSVFRNARAYFRTHCAARIDSRSLDLMRELQRAQIDSYIITELPDYLAVHAAEHLPLRANQILANEVRSYDGILSNEIQEPYLASDGKIQKLSDIIQRMRRENPSLDYIFVLGMTASSLEDDQPLRDYIQQQRLPVGHSIIARHNGATLRLDPEVSTHSD